MLRKRLLATAIAAVALLGIGAGPASADFWDDLADIWDRFTQTQEIQRSAEDQAAYDVATAVCQSISSSGVKDCAERLALTLTPEDVAAGADSICPKGPDTVSWQLRCQQVLSTPQAVQRVQAAYVDSYQAYVQTHAEPIQSDPDPTTPEPTQQPSEDPSDGVAPPDDQAEEESEGPAYIENPDSDFEEFVNTSKEDALSLAGSALNSYLSGSGFGGGSDWFRDAWAPMAGIGLALLALSWLMLQRSVAAGTVSEEQYNHSISTWLPISLLLLFFGPALGYVIGTVVDGLTTGVVNWLGDNVVAFVSDFGVSRDLVADETPGKVLSGLVVFFLMLIAGFGILVTLLLQQISIHFLGLVVGVAAGLLLHPTWRAKALRVPMVWLGFMLAKPAMLLMMGAVVIYVMNQGGDVQSDPALQAAGDGTRQLIGSLLQIIAMLVIAFAPLTLLKWFPLLPDGGEVEAVGSAGGGADVASAAASAQRGIESARHRVNNYQSRSTSSTATTSSSTASPDAPGAGPAGAVVSSQGASSATSASGAAPAAASKAGGGAAKATTGTTSSATAASTASTAAQGKAASGAAAAGRGAATAGRAAASGVLFAAAVAAKAGSVAVQKGREMADGAAPRSMNSSPRDMT